jgi:hypothetical protein
MADLPLNTFGNQAVTLTDTETTVYTVPAGITTIMLGAQATNISTDTVRVNFRLIKADLSEYVLLNNFEIPKNDAAEVSTGKLVITEGEKLSAYASSNGSINLILSYLETSNE